MMRYMLCIASVLAWGFALCGFGADAMNTRQRLAKFGADLKEVVSKNLQPSQKTVRDQLVQNLRTEFHKEIRTMKPPDGYSMAKAVTCYLDSLEETFKLFPTDDMRTERELFIRDACDTCRYEVTLTEDYKKKRTYQEVYDMLLNNCVVGMKRLAQTGSDEARKEMLTTFNTVFFDLKASATQPSVDLAQQLADNVEKAHALFPTNTEDLAKKNGTVILLLEHAAKALRN